MLMLFYSFDDGAGAVLGIHWHWCRMLLPGRVILSAIGAGQQPKGLARRLPFGEVAKILLCLRVIDEDALSLAHARRVRDAVLDQLASRAEESQEHWIDQDVAVRLVHQVQPLHVGSDLFACLYHGNFSAPHSLMT